MTAGRLANAIEKVNEELEEKLVVAIHEPVFLTLNVIELHGTSAKVILAVNDLHGKAPANVVSAILERFVPRAHYVRPELMIDRGVLVGDVKLFGLVKTPRVQSSQVKKDVRPSDKKGSDVNAEILFLKQYGT